MLFIPWRNEEIELINNNTKKVYDENEIILERFNKYNRRRAERDEKTS